MTIWDWPPADLLEIFIERKILDRSNPRPCQRCVKRTIYGNRLKRYCGPCSAELHKQQHDAARNKGTCMDCSKAIGATSKRCLSCEVLRRRAA